MRWDLLCKPMKFGGLGFRKIHEFNLAMLSKQGWKPLTEPGALVTKLFKARYFPHSFFLQKCLGSNPSYVWRGGLAFKDLINRHSRLRVRDGPIINVHHDPWLPDISSGYIITPLGVSFGDTVVQDLIVPGE